MVRVFPGVEDVFARLFRLTNRLINEDFPTLERPIKANSRLTGSGHREGSVLLTINSAE